MNTKLPIASLPPRFLLELSQEAKKVCGKGVRSALVQLARRSWGTQRVGRRCQAASYGSESFNGAGTDDLLLPSTEV